MRIPESILAIEFDGGHPSLDFTNSVHSWADAEARDYWSTPVELIAWHQHRGLVTATTADAFVRLGPAAAHRLLAEARRTRRDLYDLFAQIAVRGRARSADLAWLDDALVELAAFRHLETHRGDISWVVRPDRATPKSLLAPVLFSAAELLITANPSRIRRCTPPDGCGWLFVDTSRNGRRVWCSMRTCGNAAKVRRFRQRRTGESSASD